MPDDLLRSLADVDAALDAVDADLQETEALLNGTEAPRQVHGALTRRVETLDQLLQKHGVSFASALPRLTQVDHAVAAVLGVGGGLLDLRPAIEKGMTSEEWHQRLDKMYKARVADVTGTKGTVAIDNAVGGDVHRIFGPTHDIARLLEAIECVRRGEFRWVVSGELRERVAYRDGLEPYLSIQDPAEAALIILMHWAADFFSKRSLPIPGMSSLIEAGDKELARWAVQIYKNGVNLRTLVSQALSNLSGIALIGVALHLYRYSELFLVERRPFTLGQLNLTHDFKYRMMFRNASLAAFAVSAGAATLTQDPFRLNWAAFVGFWGNAREVERILDKRLAELDREIDDLVAQLEHGGAAEGG